LRTAASLFSRAAFSGNLALTAPSLGGTRHRRSITHAAFDCIAKTLPLGTVAFEGQLNEKGERVRRRG
jgi:hypothetical protein